MHFSSSRMTLAEDIRNSVAPEWEGFERLMGESLTSRSDSKEVSFLSLAFCTMLPKGAFSDEVQGNEQN